MKVENTLRVTYVWEFFWLFVLFFTDVISFLYTYIFNLNLSGLFLSNKCMVGGVKITSTLKSATIMKKLNMTRKSVPYPEYQGWLKMHFPAWSKVFWEALFWKIWARYLGAHTDSTVWKYVWLRHWKQKNMCYLPIMSFSLERYR